jgi:hypothetical protein
MLRDNLANILIGRANAICSVELGRLTANEGTTNTALSMIDTLFSTAATIVSGEQAKSILAGTAGAANAGRATVNANVYRNKLSDAISGAIKNERTKQLQAINDKIATKSVSEYGVDQMIREVDEYHQTCSFFNGLDLVNKAVSETKPPENTLTTETKKASDAIDTQIGALLEQKRKDSGQAATVDAAVKTLREKQTGLWTDYAQKTSDAAGK